MEQNQNPPITLELSLADVNKISEAVSELKLKDSVDVFMKIREQTLSQLKALQAPPATEEAKDE